MRLINLWPPLLGMGIRFFISPDALEVRSRLKLHWWNKNIVGTQFGGALFTMTDPICMIVLMENLGPDYVVWDKGASIRFKNPGRSDVHTRFALTSEQIDALRATADAEERVEPTYAVQILDTNGLLIAEVSKLMFIQRKDKFKRRPTSLATVPVEGVGDPLP